MNGTVRSRAIAEDAPRPFGASFLSCRQVDVPLRYCHEINNNLMNPRTMQTKTNLLSCYNAEGLIEAGCDEAGRGCLAGSVFAAAVILPDGYASNQLDDSKRLTARQRYALREVIMHDAVAWAVGEVTAKEIDEMNILNASIEAMHRALSVLAVQPRFIIVDGNRFKPYGDIPYQTIVKGDSKYQSIAAASILAKTFRDDAMRSLGNQYPAYGWERNFGYPTAAHREAIRRCGPSPFHRLTFNLIGDGKTPPKRRNV